MVNAWTTMRSCMRQMYPACDVRPHDGHDVFRFQKANDKGVVCEVKPVVFLLPERASQTQPNLFVGVKGWLSFDGGAESGELRLRSFGTNVGYFRSKKNALDHVFGVHYDIDESSVSHPVFHGQIGPQTEFVGWINEYYRGEWLALDKVGCLLRNVRVPCAEMDVFSVFLQICADHLVDGYSARRQRSTLTRLRDSCGLYLGAANRMAGLICGSEHLCFRGIRWYR